MSQALSKSGIRTASPGGSTRWVHARHAVACAPLRPSCKHVISLQPETPYADFVATWSRATRRRLAMFVVLGASGNAGKVVAETLLRQKKKVRVVLHDAAKGKAWGEAGADVAIADVDEGAALERAFSGAEGVYVLLPPNFDSNHVLE